MSLVAISGLILFIFIAFIAISSANTLYTRETARRGAVRPISDQPVAGILSSGETVPPANAPANDPPLKPVSFQAHRATPDPNSLSPSLTPAERAKTIAASIPPYDFKVMTREVPIFQGIFTYVMGDAGFERSLSLRDPIGALAGEMGVSIARSINLGGIIQAQAIDLWLFDKEDVKTPTLTFVSPRGSSDSAFRESLRRRGEITPITAGGRHSITTQALQMEVIVVDVHLLDVDPGQPEVIKSLVLEAAVWQRGEHAPAMAPAAEPAPVAAPPPPSPQRPQAKDPAVVEEKMRTSYTIDFTRRTYLNQPFRLVVSIPGLHEQGAEPAPPAPTISGLPRSPGELSFTHRYYPDYQEDARRYPAIRVVLKYDPEDFQVPHPEAMALLSPGGSAELDFIVKPLRPDVLLLTVEIYYIGVKWIPEKETEVLTTRDPVTGAVRSVTTRRTPGRLAGNVRLLQVETLRVDVRAFLALSAPELTAITRILCGVLIVTYVLWSMISGAILSLAGGIAVTGFSLLSALVVVFSPYIVGAYFNRRARNNP